MKIQGLSFSWKRAVGVTKAKQHISRTTGIPMSKSGLEHKIGKAKVYSTNLNFELVLGLLL